MMMKSLARLPLLLLLAAAAMPAVAQKLIHSEKSLYRDVLVYEERMSPQQARLWRTWTDYMQEWCAREDFRTALPRLLQGEDPGFVATIGRIAAAAAGSAAVKPL